MPDAPATAQPSLLERLETRFRELRAKDKTIKRCEREIQTHTDEIRVAHQLRKVAKLAMREQDAWLKEEAADQVRKEAGIKTIPGFASRRESAREFRARLNEKLKNAQRAAISGQPPAPTK